MSTHESARPCGCDPGASWICERHRQFQPPDYEESPGVYVWRLTAEQTNHDEITVPPYIQDLPDLPPAPRFPEVLEPNEPVVSYGDCPGCDSYLLEPGATLCNACRLVQQFNGQQADPRRI